MASDRSSFLLFACFSPCQVSKSIFFFCILFFLIRLLLRISLNFLHTSVINVEFLHFFSRPSPFPTPFSSHFICSVSYRFLLFAFTASSSHSSLPPRFIHIIYFFVSSTPPLLFYLLPLCSSSSFSDTASSLYCVALVISSSVSFVRSSLPVPETLYSLSTPFLILLSSLLYCSSSSSYLPFYLLSSFISLRTSSPSSFFSSPHVLSSICLLHFLLSLDPFFLTSSRLLFCFPSFTLLAPLFSPSSLLLTS